MNDDIENVMTEKDLDRRLEGPGQQSVRSLVRALSDDTPSMAWRSAVNERLTEASAKTGRKRRVAWVWRSSLGFGLAAALVVALYVRPHGAVPFSSADGSVEARVMASHAEAVDWTDVSGVGLTPQEAAAPDVNSTTEPFEWNQSDVASL